MAAVTLPNAGIKAGYLPLEDSWGSDLNRNLRVVDALLQARVEDKDLATPPGSPTGGVAYIVPTGATGAWSGQAAKIAVWETGSDITAAWFFVTAKSGWKFYVVDEARFYTFNGTAWQPGPNAVAPVNNQTGATYTLAIVDAGAAVRGNNASAQTYTVPTNATAAFQVGTSIAIRQVGAGAITASPAGGVTLNTPTGYLAKTGRQGATIMLHKVAADEWDVTGDLATA